MQQCLKGPFHGQHLLFCFHAFTIHIVILAVIPTSKVALQRSCVLAL
jgi:hypothetical protein